MKQPKPADKVKIILEDEEVIGTLMPRPEILKDDITVIKLNSGYNRGIDSKKIIEIQLIEEFKREEKEKKELQNKKNLPTIAIISVGGTISSKVDYRTGGVYADYTAQDFVEMIPELEDIANIKTEKVASIMSEDMAPRDWIKIAKEIEKKLNDKNIEGIVLTQGTDTLHYTAAALSFFLKDINKPVIITASQRSIDRGSSDAFMNLKCAVNAAANIECSEVLSCMHATLDDDYCILIRGTKVRKMHTSRRDAFRPINDSIIAKVYEDKRIKLTKEKTYRKKEIKREVKADTSFEDNIAMISIYPGMDPEIIDFYSNKGYKGLILSATALGHVPTEEALGNIIPNLKRAIENNMTIVISSQTLYGSVHPYVYSNLRKLSMELKCIFAYDMMPEVAYVKLGYVLGKTQDKKEIKELMQKNIAGEISERLTPKEFLN